MILVGVLADGRSIDLSAGVMVYRITGDEAPVF
jgi:hypothetical protein